MVDANVLTAKLGELAERIARVRARCPPTAAALAADRDSLDLVSFNLMLAVQICLDIASHLIADEGWAPAASAAEAFRRLSEHGVLSAATAEQLGKAAGLRNVVAHGYSAVDPELIHRAATQGLSDLEQLSQEVSGWLAGR
ncbi:MAG TPA: DUF86 domain-containing protein [Thermoanaerobaculia bacterium]|jgi:uncharacterized protein YutE (UPF0331/DUF86 family)|nr:DUF86 domain-containing protein [Thermoanaerobaculia bacterium]